MKIVIAGGTGFIGRRLREALRREGEEVTLLVRTPARVANPGWREIVWGGEEGGSWERVVEGADAVINLAGAPIAGRRWSAARKELLRRSRIGPTRALVGAIRRASAPPVLFVNASAVGYYGHVPEGDVTEEVPCGTGFLPGVCAEWEEEALAAESAGVRVVCLRTGIVLGEEGGALSRMVLPFRFFVGGPIGSGRQWLPWIHADDCIGILLFLLRNEISGPVNCTAPAPVRMSEFSRALGAVLRRPSWFPVPAFLLSLLLGEMAAIVLDGQRAIPAKLLRNGYPFRHPELIHALRALLTPG